MRERGSSPGQQRRHGAWRKRRMTAEAEAEAEARGTQELQVDAETLEFCRQLPKVELHAHLNGCVRDETLRWGPSLQRDEAEARVQLMHTGTLGHSASVWL